MTEVYLEREAFKHLAGIYSTYRGAYTGEDSMFYASFMRDKFFNTKYGIKFILKEEKQYFWSGEPVSEAEYHRLSTSLHEGPKCKLCGDKGMVAGDTIYYPCHDCDAKTVMVESEEFQENSRAKVEDRLNDPEVRFGLLKGQLTSFEEAAEANRDLADIRINNLENHVKALQYRVKDLEEQAEFDREDAKVRIDAMAEGMNSTNEAIKQVKDEVAGLIKR